MDNYTMDELILAFALKFENNALEILQRLYEGDRKSTRLNSSHYV